MRRHVFDISQTDGEPVDRGSAMCGSRRPACAVRPLRLARVQQGEDRQECTQRPPEPTALGFSCLAFQPHHTLPQLRRTLHRCWIGESDPPPEPGRFSPPELIVAHPRFVPARLIAQGSARIRMREGAELLIEAGQFYEVPPAMTPGWWGMSRGSRSTGSRVRRSRARRAAASTEWWRRDAQVAA